DREHQTLHADIIPPMLDQSMRVDSRFMERALSLAAEAIEAGQTPFGAVVVGRDGNAIGEGYNRVRADLDPAAHAEIVAIRAAWRRAGSWNALAGSTLYSTCEPCLLCTFAIAQIGFAGVVFAARGTDVPAYRPLLGGDLLLAATWINAQPDWPRLQVVSDFMREQAIQLINDFPWHHAATREPLSPK